MQSDDLDQVTPDIVERISRSTRERDDDSALNCRDYQRRQRASFVRIDTGSDQSIGEDSAPLVDRFGGCLGGRRRFRAAEDRGNDWAAGFHLRCAQLRLPLVDEGLDGPDRVASVVCRPDHCAQRLPGDTGGFGHEFCFAAREIQVDGSSRDAAVLQQGIETGSGDAATSNQTGDAGDEGVTRGHGLNYTDWSTSVMAVTNTDKTLRKFRRERAVGRLLNPAVKGLSRLGLRTALATELETVGRKTGQARRVPVSAQFDHDGAWVICQHGTRSGWGRNIADNPNVRVRQGHKWRAGLAKFRPDDDVVARGRKFGRVGAKVAKALETTPVSVRIDFTD
jgi:deazaflavin-dependent oxidoreductase (nitroreductase family)